MNQGIEKYRFLIFPDGIKWSVRILLFIFLTGLLGKFIANDVPIIGKKDGKISMPVLLDIANDLNVIDWKNRYTYNHLDNEFDFAIKPLIPYSCRYMDNKNAGYKSPFDKQEVKSVYYRHWLGTDDLGRDVLAGMIRGAWIAFLVSFLSVLMALLIGVPLGLWGGYYGNSGWDMSVSEILISLMAVFLLIYYYIFFASSFFAVILSLIGFGVSLSLVRLIHNKFFPSRRTISLPIDSILNKVIEVFKSIPTLIILFLFLGVMSISGILPIALIIGLVIWVRISRYIRAETLAIKENEFVKSLRAMGNSDWNIMIYHILPIVFPPVIVSIIFLTGSVILMEATLSFFGIGLSVEEVSWGGMLNEARKYFGAWWLAVFPGIALFTVIATLGNIGQYATKRLNPKLQD